MAERETRTGHIQSIPTSLLPSPLSRTSVTDSRQSICSRIVALPVNETNQCHGQVGSPLGIVARTSLVEERRVAHPARRRFI